MSSSSHSSAARGTSSANATASATSSTAPPFTGFSKTYTSPTLSTPTLGGGQGADGGGSAQQNAQGQQAPNASTSLYLYTFLATLILLLGVSSAIVARSICLRRRHRRMVADALANGTWLPPPARPRVDLRKKPRLWDAWVQPPMLGAYSFGAGGGKGAD
ncbi:hypothetical protein K438DRAFT_2019185, partial [Mycena galopus ATCC 62051]